jgi:hypothetical protein
MTGKLFYGIVFTMKGEMSLYSLYKLIPEYASQRIVALHAACPGYVNRRTSSA